MMSDDARFVSFFTRTPKKIIHAYRAGGGTHLAGLYFSIMVL